MHALAEDPAHTLFERVRRWPAGVAIETSADLGPVKPIELESGDLALAIELPSGYADPKALATEELDRAVLVLSGGTPPPRSLGVDLESAASALARLLGPDADLRGAGEDWQCLHRGVRLWIRRDAANLLAVATAGEALAARDAASVGILARWARRANAGLRVARVSVEAGAYRIGARIPARGFAGRPAESAARALAECMAAVFAAAAVLPSGRDLSDPRVLAPLSVSMGDPT